MKKFYFLREPDHMVECSETLPECSNLDIIKQKHLIFDTEEDALEYQRVLGVQPKSIREILNRQFEEGGLAVAYGYTSVPSNEKCDQKGVIEGLVDSKEMRALKQFEVPSGDIKVWDLPDGYEFRDENGNVIEAKKIMLKKKDGNDMDQNRRR